jgi:hypothetical protein
MNWVDQLDTIVRQQRDPIFHTMASQTLPSTLDVPTGIGPRPDRVWWRLVSLPYSEDSYCYRWNSAPQDQADSLLEEILHETNFDRYHVMGRLRLCKKAKQEIQLYIDDPNGLYRLIIAAYAGD